MNVLDRIEAFIGAPQVEDPRIEEARQQVAAALKGRVAPEVEAALAAARYRQVAQPAPLSAAARMLQRGTPSRIPVSRRAYR